MSLIVKRNYRENLQGWNINKINNAFTIQNRRTANMAIYKAKVEAANKNRT